MPLALAARKLVLVLATFTSKIMAIMEAELAAAPKSKIPASDTKNPTLPLKCVLCIHYPLYFKKDKSNVEDLIDSGS